MNKSGAFRKKKNYFTQVSNTALRDNTLSTKAKGLYSLIQSYITIPNFILYKTTLKKDCLEKERAFESMWKELKNKGYLIQYKLKNDNGCFYYEYELLDEPQKTENEKSIKNENEISQSQLYSHSIHTLQNVGVDNATGRKEGVYNNTIPNNTDLNNTNSINKKKKEKIHKGYKTIIEEYTTNLELQQAIYSFIEMRKANKSIITDRALIILLNKLNLIAFSDIEKTEVLNNSVINCWKSIFPIEEKKVISKVKGSEVLDKINQRHSVGKQLGFINFDARKYSQEDYKFFEVTSGQRDISSIDRDKLNILKNSYDNYIKENNIEFKWENNEYNGIKGEQRILLPNETKKANIDEIKEEYVNPVYLDMLQAIAK